MALRDLFARARPAAFHWNKNATLCRLDSVLPFGRRRTPADHSELRNEPSRDRRSRGQSIVELTLLMPVLLLILLGAIDLGRAYYAYVSITNAARVGTEYAMEPRRPQTDVREKIKDEAAPNITLQDSDITFNTLAWAKGYDLTIEVRTPFTAVTPLISSLWGGGPLTMSARSTTRFN